MRLGSTSVSSAIRPPVICSRRAVRARTSASVSGRGARGDGVDDPVALVVEPAELGRDARQLLDPAAPDEQQDEVADRLAEVGEDAARHDLDPLSSGQRRVGEDRHQLGVRRARPPRRRGRDRHASSVPSRIAISKAASA